MKMMTLLLLFVGLNAYAGAKAVVYNEVSCSAAYYIPLKQAGTPAAMVYFSAKGTSDLRPDRYMNACQACSKATIAKMKQHKDAKTLTLHRITYTTFDDRTGKTITLNSECL